MAGSWLSYTGSIHRKRSARVTHDCFKQGPGTLFPGMVFPVYKMDTAQKNTTAEPLQVTLEMGFVKGRGYSRTNKRKGYVMSSYLFWTLFAALVLKPVAAVFQLQSSWGLSHCICSGMCVWCVSLLIKSCWALQPRAVRHISLPRSNWYLSMGLFGISCTSLSLSVLQEKLFVKDNFIILRIQALQSSKAWLYYKLFS